MSKTGLDTILALMNSVDLLMVNCQGLQKYFSKGKGADNETGLKGKERDERNANSKLEERKSVREKEEKNVWFFQTRRGQDE